MCRQRRLNRIFILEASPLDLSGCPGLQRLQFFIVFDERERAVISSITSTSIRAIVFTPYLAHAAFRKILENPEPFIPPLDNILSTLVDRLRASGYKHTLVLEFRLIDLIPGYTLDLKKSLPKFREKGRVILKHWLTEETIELSVRFLFIFVTRSSPSFLTRVLVNRATPGALLPPW